jgi:ADP-ribose pyrophosphatase YjhB (NUDIX family)
MSSTGCIRAKVVCLLLCRGETGWRSLWIEARDAVKDEDFLFPPGGGVEFGESLDEAIRRELREELGVEPDHPVLLGFSENRFTFNGVREHEIVFIYAAVLVDCELTRCAVVEVVESSGERLPARWYTPDELNAAGLVVYPDGILAHLRQAVESVVRGAFPKVEGSGRC